MTYVQKARLTFLGIDDELKNDPTSVYTTNLNSFFSYSRCRNSSSSHTI